MKLLPLQLLNGYHQFRDLHVSDPQNNGSILLIMHGVYENFNNTLWTYSIKNNNFFTFRNKKYIKNFDNWINYSLTCKESIILLNIHKVESR